MEAFILRDEVQTVLLNPSEWLMNLTNEPTLVLENSIIYNMSSIGLFAQGSRVYGKNLLIFNCGQHLIALNIGGAYRFQHCTFARCEFPAMEICICRGPL